MSAPLHGTTIVITGASSGLGAAAARELASRGATIAVVGRNPERTKLVAEQVGGTPFLADYDELGQVRALAAALLERYETIDVLANNAGGLVAKRATTVDGHERTFQHNHLAPFLLTSLLLPRLRAASGRVISTASAANLGGRVRIDDLDRAHRAYLAGWPAYGTSKLETIMFIEELARREPMISAYAFHPGYVSTNFGTELAVIRFANFVSGKRLGISPEQGGAPLVHLASAPEVGVPSGTYFDGLKPGGRTAPQAKDAALAAALWNASESMVTP
ncbi:MAG: short-chain dehydrogenase [Microbacteriaceae bacterium]|jgi:NAD(P)-dependent dehydrogenase (short-subunit alcohol dehydrogenase family)|nr:short-chain dehydrogenase [Microbacteriaceae bacterium]